MRQNDSIRKKDLNKLDLPVPIRLAIYDRDGESCRVCGSVAKLEIHHILPRGLGRYHDYCNLILLCSVCHDLVEAGRLPHWNVESKEKLYHISPVKAFSHFMNFTFIKCVTHDLKISDEECQPPIRAYAIKGTEPVFSF